jgi:Family of unknown function (DUF6778)
MKRRTWIAGALAALALAGCSGSWQVAYDTGLDPEVTRGWKLVDVIALVPEDLSVSNNNSYAPSADIVWHGEPFGDRRAQVAAIIDDGLTMGATELQGTRPVTITARVIRFHAVTPAAVARAPSAVHNIRYVIQVLDAQTGDPLTAPQEISADLEAYVGAAAIAAAINGQTQRVRIVDHLANVTRGWLGFGPDQRRAFRGIGR